MSDNIVVKLATPCPAMSQAGIDDPESYEGIHFCTGQCPYPTCIIVKERTRTTLLKAEVYRLVHQGLSPREIAKQLDVHLRTVQRHLKRGRS